MSTVTEAVDSLLESERGTDNDDGSEGASGEFDSGDDTGTPDPPASRTHGCGRMTPRA